MASKPMTETGVRALKARETPYKVSDGGGLHLLVSTSGTKTWRLAYRFEGQQRCLTLGAHPKVSLADARRSRQAAKDRLEAGCDPASPEEDGGDGPTFRDAALEWHAAQEPRWTRLAAGSY